MLFLFCLGLLSKQPYRNFILFLTFSFELRLLLFYWKFNVFDKFLTNLFLLLLCDFNLDFDVDLFLDFDIYLDFALVDNLFVSVIVFGFIFGLTFVLWICLVIACVVLLLFIVLLVLFDVFDLVRDFYLFLYVDDDIFFICLIFYI